MTNQVTIPLYEDLLNGFSTTTAENESVQQARRRGLESFKRSGFPTRKNEYWKYTSVTHFLQEQYHINSIAKDGVAAPALLKQAAIPHLDCYQLVLVNGQLQTETSALPSFLKVISIK